MGYGQVIEKIRLNFSADPEDNGKSQIGDMTAKERAYLGAKKSQENCDYEVNAVKYGHIWVHIYIFGIPFLWSMKLFINYV